MDCVCTLYALTVAICSVYIDNIVLYFFFVVSCRLLARCLLSTNIQHPIYSVVVVAVNSENRSQQCVLWCERSSFLSVDQVIQTYTMLLYGSRVYAATDVAFTARKWQRKIINKNQKKKKKREKIRIPNDAANPAERILIIIDRIKILMGFNEAKINWLLFGGACDAIVRSRVASSLSFGSRE